MSRSGAQSERGTARIDALFEMLLARGGSDGQLRPLKSDQPIVLASYESKPMLDDVRVVNKVSQNLHAEILLRLLGDLKK